MGCYSIKLILSCNTKRNLILDQCVLAEISVSFCAVELGKCRPVPEYFYIEKVWANF